MIHQHWEQFLQGADDRTSAPPGMAYLPELAAMRFEGPDVRKFLQGYLTCDTDELQAGHLTPTALCNLKGRVVMNGWCAPAGDDDTAPAVTLILHASLVARLQRFLEAYLKFSRTRVLDQRSDTLVLGTLDLAPGDGLVMDARRALHPVQDLEQAKALWARHPHLTAAAWHASLTADGIPLLCDTVSEAFLPQMLDLQNLGAINFDKGCYLGQEVVARAQHRGQVKRRLARLAWRGDTPPAAGSEVTDGAGKPQGMVLQTTTDGSGLLLAVLSRDAPAALRQGDTVLSPVPSFSA